jgi:tetratricopeptide (TPR) repeat protein
MHDPRAQRFGKGGAMRDEDSFEGGHIDTPFPDSEVQSSSRRRHSDPIDTPYPADGFASRPQPVHTPEPRFWRLRQRVNPYFMGRESLLATLHHTFQSKPIVHLLGPMGSGTTQTALSYAFRARANFDGAFWIDAKDPTLARLDLVRAGRGLDGKWNDEAPIQDQLAAIKHWMGTHLRWLLVCDGATSLEHLLALIPAQPNGRVLITGHTPLDDERVTVLKHPSFPHPAACLFLAHRSQQQRDEHASALVRLFGHATLPVFLAGAFCHVTSTPLQDYRQRIDASLAKHDPPHSASDLEQGVLAAVEQSLHYLSERDPAALEMIALCAYMDPEDIALAMLCDGAPFLPKRLGACVSSPDQLNATLTLLHKLGLVQFEQNSITVHPCIQTATRFLLGREQEFAWLMTALRVVREAFPVESRYAQPIPACSNLVRHTQAVTLRSEHANQLREGTGLLLNHTGLYLHACKEHAAARDCFERSIRCAETLYGAVHPTIAARANSLGVILQDLGCFEEARACYERAFRVCEAVYGPARDAALGPAHRSMLTMPSRNLCQVLELMGDVRRAKMAYQHAIKVFMEVYCWNHSLVAESMSGLGQLFIKEKDYVTARQYFQKAIQAEEHAEQPELGNLGKFTRNLAQCLLEQHDAPGAWDLYEHALHIDRDDYGPVHRHVAADLMGMGKSGRALNRHADAQRCFDEALAVYKALTSQATREKAAVWRQKGRAFMDDRDFDKAVYCLNEALVTTRLAEGADSPALGPDFIYLGRALARLGQLAEAEDAMAEALKLHERTPWMDDDALVSLYSRVGKIAKELKQLNRAAEYLRAAMTLNEARYGREHEQVAADAFGLGNLYLALKDPESALDYFQAARDIYAETRGPDDPKTLRAAQRIEALGQVRY